MRHNHTDKPLPCNRSSTDYCPCTLIQNIDSHTAISNSAMHHCSISSLPPELLARIFELGKVMQCEDEPYPARSKPFEVVMSHVSSHFRSVAVQDRVLWSCISIIPSLSPLQVQTYLQRSSGCGLGVRIDLTDAPTPSPLTLANINLIAPYFNKYRQLIIDSVRESITCPVLRYLCNVAMPDLQYLSLSVDEIEGFNPSADDDGILQRGAPNLAFVRLRGLALPFFCPPLAHVTTLHLDQTAPLPILYTTFRDVITAPHNLINLSVYGDIIEASHNGESWPETNNPIHLPYLRCLRICGVNGIIYSGLLLSINAPALNSLVLKDLKECDLERFWAVSANAFKFPSLRNLTFLDSDVSGDGYLAIFHGFPNITTFTAAHHSTMVEMLLLLTEPPEDINNIYWPMLHTLTLVTNLYDDTEHLFAPLVKQRNDLGCPLHKLRLGLDEPLSSLPCYKWLRKNVVLEAFVTLDGWPRASADFEDDPGDDLFF